MKVGWRSPAVGWSTDDCCGWILREVSVSVVRCGGIRVGAQVDGLSGAAAGRCGTVRGGDADAGGDVDGGRYGDDQTCAGFCDGGDDCCEVGVGMVVVVVLVRRRCPACLL